MGIFEEATQERNCLYQAFLAQGHDPELIPAAVAKEDDLGRGSEENVTELRLKT